MVKKTTKRKTSMRRQPAGQSGGVSLSVGRDSHVGGDVVGRDKITTSGVSGDELARLLQHFSQIQQKIDARPPDPDVDKAELKETVEKIEDEVKKGEAANPNKVERWLMNLGAMADDIFQVTANTLINPVLGIATVIQKVAQKAKAEQAKSDGAKS